MVREEARRCLHDVFGHDDFFAPQAALVEQVLGGRDVLAVMPTGAGKSIVYQVPALVLPGITLVVSPLISLMKDQVSALVEQGVAAAFVNSSQSPVEQDETFDLARRGAIKLLYVAPERLGSARLARLVEGGAVSLVAVDEAHCVSQWGQDFRPSYLAIKDFVARLSPRPPVAALTATATEDVRGDIVEKLGLRDPYVLVSGFDRPNLYFGVERPDPHDKLDCLIGLVRDRSQKAGVVYCSTRAAVEEVCEALRLEGMAVTRYHGGLSAEERQRNQDDFLFDRATVMVATNAFGMGIDKSNVGYVIHYNMPGDIESYYQEAGRAGRDGTAADCILIYNRRDVQTQQYLIDKKSDEVRDGGLDDEHADELYQRDCERLRRMTVYATTTDCLRAHLLRYFGETSSMRCDNCSNCEAATEDVDVTVEAQKILSCVYRIAERGRQVGAAMVVDVLRGSTSQKVRRWQFDTLSTYGLMSDVPTKRVRRILEELVEAGYLGRALGRYPTVYLTDEGRSWLRSRGEFHIKVQLDEARAHRRDAQVAGWRDGGAGAGDGARGGGPSAAMGGGPSAVTPDDDLYEALRELRHQIATEEGVPAYIVFSNATLEDMVRKRPMTTSAFLAVKGVGRVKAERYGERFLERLSSWERADAS